MIKLESQKYVLDYGSRFFTEDIPFGMLMIRAFAERQGITVEMIDTVIGWAQNVMNREYLRDGVLNGCDLTDTIVPYVL